MSSIDAGGIAYCHNCGQGWGTLTVNDDGTAPCTFCGADQMAPGRPLPVKWWRRRRYLKRHALAPADRNTT